jgi:hypothetical protein
MLPAGSELIACKALPADADAFVAEMRDADKREVFAATGTSSLHRTVLASINLSRTAYSVWTHDMEPVALLGVSHRNAISTGSTLWMIATDRLAQHWREFARRCRDEIGDMVVSPEILSNYVDARNGKALRFVQWLGAEIEPAAPYGPFGLPFHRFELRI